MEQFIIALNAVLPLFVVIGIGYFLRKYNVLSKQTFKELNKLTFSLLLPLHIVKQLMNATFQSDTFNILYIGLLIILMIGSYVILMKVVNLFEKENHRKGVFVQGIIRSNFIIIAFPIITNLFGEQAVPLASLLLFVSMIFLNPMAVMSLSYYQKQRPNLNQLLKNIILNPLVVATLIGVTLMFFNVNLPMMITKPLDMVSGLGTPIALLSLGGLLEVSSIKHNLKSLFNVLLIKLILIPLIVILVFPIFDFSRLEIMSAIIFFGAPTAVTTYPMADAMGADGEFAQHIVLLSTLMSAITLVFWLSIV